MDGIILLLLLVLAGLLFDARRRIAALERALRGSVEPVALPTATAATPVPIRPQPAPHRKPKLPDFETLVGGKLPVWIGGIALVLAGFFLVRAAIDGGLLGPGVRALLAAVFAVCLIAASEAARRFGPTSEDPRIAQVLAGAGIASGYGTLYLAAALYDLIAPLPAFAIMLGITGIALALAIRHGPPTAIMALIGGFLAPLVAGYDAAGIGALLVYLALFTAALFGLGINRGWGWLAIGAALAGFAWANFLGLAVASGDVAAVAVFVVVLAVASAAAFPVTGARASWLRTAALAAGLVQLLVFAPRLDFGVTAWSLYLVLALAAVALAWRDVRLVGAPTIAALLALPLLAMSPIAVAGPAALAATALFIGGGLVRSRSHAAWAATALLGAIGPVLVLHAVAPQELVDVAWAALELTAAAAAAYLSWRHRDRGETIDLGLVGGAIGAALAGTVALSSIFDAAIIGIALTLVMVALHGWARRTAASALFTTPALAFAAALVATAPLLAAFVIAALSSIGGDHLPFEHLPTLWTTTRDLAPPVVAAAILLRLDPRAFGRARSPVAMLVAIGVVALGYLIAKQPLAIATDPAFTVHGFGERAAITQLFLASGWLIARTDRAPRLAAALLFTAMFRVAWFDLVLLDPLLVPQRVGTIPILNIAALHAGLTALLLWSWPRPVAAIRLAALALTLLAALVIVRQAAHGTFLTGPVGTAENWGYSAAMLAVAIAWLWRGIAGGARDLRFAGLGLALVVSLKVFTIDIALEGLLRVVSFLGIGVTLIAIGWFYTRFLARAAPVTPADNDPPADRAPA